MSGNAAGTGISIDHDLVPARHGADYKLFLWNQVSAHSKVCY